MRFTSLRYTRPGAFVRDLIILGVLIAIAATNDVRHPSMPRPVPPPRIRSPRPRINRVPAAPQRRTRIRTSLRQPDLERLEEPPGRPSMDLGTIDEGPGPR
jgi:hypothetical protein